MAPAKTTSSPTPPKPQVAGTAAFSKFMHVLQLAADAEVPVSVSSLMHASGYPRPTVHRIVAALVAEGLLMEGHAAGTFALGARLMQLASRAWGGSELRLAAEEALRQLRDETGETVHLAVPSGGAMVFIEKLEAPGPVRMSSSIGRTVPLHVTSVGKSYLAALDERERAAILKTITFDSRTPHSIVSPKAFREELARVQAQGWGCDDEENEEGIVCFGAAIRNAEGRPVGAVSVSTLLFRQKPDVTRSYVEPVLKAAHAISQRIARSPALGR